MLGELSFRKIHNILGLVIGLQILFWTASGFYFTLFPIDVIRGTTLRTPKQNQALRLDDVSITLQHSAAAIDPYDALVSAELESFLGEPFWRLTTTSATVLLSAQTG